MHDSPCFIYVLSLIHSRYYLFILCNKNLSETLDSTFSIIQKLNHLTVFDKDREIFPKGFFFTVVESL